MPNRITTLQVCDPEFHLRLVEASATNDHSSTADGQQKKPLLLQRLFYFYSIKCYYQNFT
jgi:hypothetical protein